MNLTVVVEMLGIAILLTVVAAPDKGTIIYNGKDIKDIDKYEFRSKYIGVIFQSYNLITKFTAVENVILSIDIAGEKAKTSANALWSF